MQYLHLTNDNIKLWDIFNHYIVSIVSIVSIVTYIQYLHMNDDYIVSIVTYM